VSQEYPLLNTLKVANSNKKSSEMHIVVCCKGVPNEPRNFARSEDRSGIRYDADSVRFNESDEYAVDQAVLLKKKLGAKVSVVTLGNLASQEILYGALAKGADDAIRINSEAWSPAVVAVTLGKAIANKSPDLVLVGVQSADQMASLVGGFLAEALGWPFVFAVTSFDMPGKEGWINLEREMGEGTKQKLEVELPCVLGVQTGICRLTYAPPARRLRAREKAIEVLNPADLGLSPEVLMEYRTEEIEEIEPPRVAGSAEILTGEPTEIAGLILAKIRETR